MRFSDCRAREPLSLRPDPYLLLYMGGGRKTQAHVSDALRRDRCARICACDRRGRGSGVVRHDGDLSPAAIRPVAADGVARHFDLGFISCSRPFGNGLQSDQFKVRPTSPATAVLKGAVQGLL